MNRRIRNRTYGGVGGRRAQALLLPDVEPNRSAEKRSFRSPKQRIQANLIFR